MEIAIEQALAAAEKGEVPVGAVLVDLESQGALHVDRRWRHRESGIRGKDGGRPHLESRPRVGAATGRMRTRRPYLERPP